MKVHKGPLKILLLLILLPSFVSAEWKDFIPVPFENGAEIRFFASFEEDDNVIGDNRFHWDDVFLREKFSLYSRGYSYHPRFIQYNLLFSTGLKQEDYSASFFDTAGYQQRSGIEYNARFFVLPEHPYNLEVYALRLEPLYKEHSAVQHDNVETGRGVLFRYNNRPYFFDAKYTQQKTTSDLFTTDTRRFGAGASYYKEFGGSKLLSLAANYSHPTFTNSEGLEGTSDEYFVNGLVRNNWLSFTSNVSKATIEQEGLFSGVLSSDHFSILELLTAYLPLNFKTDFQYQFQDNRNTIGAPGFAEDLRAKRKEGFVRVSHRLYESLGTHYTFRKDNSEFSTGESHGTFHAGSIDYTKRTRIGRLQANVNLDRAVTENFGEATVVNEPHSGVSVPGSFLLNQPQQVDSFSIEVFLESPLPPNELILLEENVHYTIQPEANTFRINIISLPPQFAVPETYDFIVSYSLSTGTFKLRTDTFGYDVSFDYLYTLTPYLHYVKSSPTVLSGELPGFLFDSTTWSAGLIFHKNGWHVLGEYQRLDWEVSPFRGIRFEARYSGPVTPTLTVSGSAEYLNRYYPEGSSFEDGLAYTDERTILTGRVQKQLFHRSLRLSGGGTYTRYSALTDGNAYTLNVNLAWFIARLDFNLGATAHRAESEGSLFDHERTHRYYYLNVGRKLF